MWFFQELIRQKVYSRIDCFWSLVIPMAQQDKSFGVIEHYTSRIETVYTPHQWYEYMRNAATGIEVNVMEQSSFRNCDRIYENPSYGIFSEN